ncbi:hypothetical protein B9Z55_015291 [Caenorhabditis nigoni]|uniref:CCHC-type domain-containing protein n=1 Tax=Caenorhabditis nigoni TaxID=1611254 RepID=A0A2G5U9J9_9PELO|nr:hypothetical protein B9Z55_015291 [Caenorhabditis nigoni]
MNINSRFQVGLRHLEADTPHGRLRGPVVTVLLNNALRLRNRSLPGRLFGPRRPAPKIMFTKRATAARNLISQVTEILQNQSQPDFIAIIQNCYNALNEFILSLTNYEGEALMLVKQHPALSSTSEIRKRNIQELINHIKSRHYDSLVNEMDDLLSIIEALLQEQPNNRRRKTDLTPINHSEVMDKLVKIPSMRHTKSSSQRKKEETGSYGPIQSKKQEPDFRKEFLPNQETPILRNNRSKSKSHIDKQINPHHNSTDTNTENHQIQKMLTMMMDQFRQLSSTTNQSLKQIHQVQNQLVSNMNQLQANFVDLQDQLDHIHSSDKLPSLQTNPTKQGDTQRDQHVDSSEQSFSVKVTPRAKQLHTHQQQIMSPENTTYSPSPSFYGMDINTILQTIKPFSGKQDEYSLFITRFNSLVHKNPSLEPAMKQNILISLLEGDAKELITSDQLSEWAYDDLRSNLEKVYNKTTDRRKQLMENYRNLPFHQTDYVQMERDTMKHICIINSLQRIGITVDDPFLVDSFIDKLPSIIMKTVIKNNRKKNMSFMDTAALVQTLISENKAVAEAEQRKKNRSQLNEIYTAEVNNASIQPPASTSGQSSPMPRGQKSYPPHKGGHKTFSQGPTPPWKTNPCKFCDAKHETRNCPLSPQEKRKKLQELNLCGNCLGNSHIAKDCRAKWTCYICHQKHHKSLCLNKGKMDMLINLLNVNNIEDTTEFFRKNGVDV